MNDIKLAVLGSAGVGKSGEEAPGGAAGVPRGDGCPAGGRVSRGGTGVPRRGRCPAGGQFRARLVNEL